jgi:hypothetical protein
MANNTLWEGMKRVNGAPTRTRTADLLITNQLLYQLSYRGTKGRLKGSDAGWQEGDLTDLCVEGRFH